MSSRTAQREHEGAPASRTGGGRTRRAVARSVALVLVLLTWLSVAGVGGPLVGRLSEVQRNDNASFLPDSAESTRVSELSAGFTEDETLPYFLVVERSGGLQEGDLAAVQEFVDGLGDLPLPGEENADLTVGDYLADQPVPVVPSEDGEAVLAVIGLDAQEAERNLPDGESVVFGVGEAIRDGLAEEVAGDGLDPYLAGPGGVLADLVNAFAGIDGRLLQVTLAVVFVILLLVYRSPVLPFAALMSSLFALAAAGGVIYPLADAGTIDLSGQSQGILFILVVGAATDYALLLVARYREELHDHESKYQAMKVAWRATLEPVAASGSTVVLGLLCLLLADLASTRGLGPVGAIGIVAAMLSVMTFLPVLLLWPVIVLLLVLGGVLAGVGAFVAGPTGALVALGAVLVTALVLAVLRRRALAGAAPGDRLAWYARPASGRWLFWPRVPGTDGVRASDAVDGTGLWGRVARLVGGRPRVVWGVTVAALLGLSAFAPTFEADGLAQTEVFREEQESVVGQEVIDEHFPGGAGSPALVLAPEELAEEALEATRGADGVASASFTAAAPPPGVGGPGAGGPGAGGPGAAAPGGAGADPEPLVVDGLVRIEAVLEEDAGSPAAERVVADLRERLDDVSDEVLVGGSTASNLDVREASNRDLQLIVPSILAVVLVVLVLLLRSVVAPVLLVLANVLSFAATIGVSAIVFNEVLDLPGGDPTVPLFGFVFLVALGIDYSIFLMTRVREESVNRGTRPGVLVGLAVTGGVITSAGIVLAATFSALVTLPLVFLLQIAFIVAFGVLLDTFVVRSLLVPALSYDLGRRVWWPSRLARRASDPDGARGSTQEVVTAGERR
ncbi:MMPL family transporter [Thalassiella azotivora]